MSKLEDIAVEEELHPNVGEPDKEDHVRADAFIKLGLTHPTDIADALALAFKRHRMVVVNRLAEISKIASDLNDADRDTLLARLDSCHAIATCPHGEIYHNHGDGCPSCHGNE